MVLAAIARSARRHPTSTSSSASPVRLCVTFVDRCRPDDAVTGLVAAAGGIGDRVHDGLGLLVVDDEDEHRLREEAGLEDPPAVLVRYPALPAVPDRLDDRSRRCARCVLDRIDHRLDAFPDHDCLDLDHRHSRLPGSRTNKKAPGVPLIPEAPCLFSGRLRRLPEESTIAAPEGRSRGDGSRLRGREYRDAQQPSEGWPPPRRRRSPRSAPRSASASAGRRRALRSSRPRGRGRRARVADDSVARIRQRSRPRLVADPRDFPPGHRSRRRSLGALRAGATRTPTCSSLWAARRRLRTDLRVPRRAVARRPWGSPQPDRRGLPGRRRRRRAASRSRWPGLAGAACRRARSLGVLRWLSPSGTSWRPASRIASSCATRGSRLSPMPRRSTSPG